MYLTYLFVNSYAKLLKLTENEYEDELMMKTDTLLSIIVED